MRCLIVIISNRYGFLFCTITTVMVHCLGACIRRRYRFLACAISLNHEQTGLLIWNIRHEMSDPDHEKPVRFSHLHDHSNIYKLFTATPLACFATDSLYYQKWIRFMLTPPAIHYESDRRLKNLIHEFDVTISIPNTWIKLSTQYSECNSTRPCRISIRQKGDKHYCWHLQTHCLVKTINLIFSPRDILWTKK